MREVKQMIFTVAVLGSLASPGWGGEGGKEASGYVGTGPLICRKFGNDSEAIVIGGEDGVQCMDSGGVEDPWTLYAVGTGGESNQALEAFMANADPAIAGPVAAAELPSAYCQAVGGKPVVYRDAQARALDMCEFEDGSSIDLKTLLAGPDGYPSLGF